MWMRFLSVVLLAALMVGCERLPWVVAEREREKVEVEVEPPPQWSWEAHPLGSEIVLAVVPVKVLPRRERELRAESAGELTLQIEQRERVKVRQGQCWARLNEEESAQREEELMLLSRRQKLEETRTRELEWPEQQAAARAQLDSALKKVTLLERLRSSPVRDELSEAAGVSAEELGNDALRLAREELDLARKRFDFVTKSGSTLMEDESMLGRLELQRQIRELRKLTELSALTAPFEGELTLSERLRESHGPVRISARESLGVVRDLTAIRASLPLTNPAWLQPEPDRLSLRLVSAPDARFSFHSEGVAVERRERVQKHFLFERAEDEKSNLTRFLDAQVEAALLCALAQPCRLVSKTALALHAGRLEVRADDWQQLVAALWPEVQVVAVGDRELAIAVPES